MPFAGATANADLFVAKYTDEGPTGTFRWSQVGGGNNTDQGQGVAVSVPVGGGSPRVYVTGSIVNSNAAANANAVVFGGAGTTLGSSPQLGASASTTDVLLAKYTDEGATGTFRWRQVGGGTSGDTGYGVAVSGQNMYAAGAVLPIATFGAITLTSLAGASLNVLARALDNTLAPLPVQLVQFTATAAGPRAARLAWATASEVGSAYFAIERSADGIAWHELGRVSAAGNSASVRTYNFTDSARPANGAVQYYRLRQVDQDGTSAYSPVRTVTLGTGGLALYPNPAHGGAAILTGPRPARP